MIRILVFIVAIALVALGLAWLADQPGSLHIEWFGYAIETSAFVGALAIAALAAAVLVLWGIFRFLLTRPGAIAAYMKERRRRQGFEALTHGLLAIGIGDRSLAEYHATAARRLLPNEPLTALLRAQSAQLKDDREGARRAFETMIDRPETALLGLRGLFLEATRRNDPGAARAFVEQAVARAPGLAWSVKALFDLQARAGDWGAARKTLAIARQHEHIDVQLALRRRAALLTAEARELEAADPEKALSLSTEALRLAPQLIPAAEIAGRILAAKGEARKAGRLIAKTWKLNPHPNLALVYAHAKPGEAPKDRLTRVKYLASYKPDDIEAPIAIATAAIEAHEWEEARIALAPYLGDRPPTRICALMARIEAGEFGDRGREREWLARAVRAPRDRAWIADGYISDRWLPVSPVTGQVDAFEWKAPMDAIGRGDETILIERAASSEPAPPPAGMAEMRPSEPEMKDVTQRPPVVEAVIRHGPPSESVPQRREATPPPVPSAYGEDASASEGAGPPPALPALARQDPAAHQDLPTVRQENAPPRPEASPATQNIQTPYSGSRFVPVGPPDDPGVSDQDLDEALSDLERLRSAQAR